MTLFELALYWQKQEISTIPVFYRSKMPAIKSWLEYQKRVPTEQEIRNWFFGRTYRNIALVTGKIVVLDFDDLEEYGKWLFWMSDKEEAKVVAQYSFKVLTRRGIHVYCFLDKPVRSFKLPGIDVKGIGGYILIPPSVHPSGAQYKAMDEDAPILSVSSLEAILPECPHSQAYTEQTALSYPNINGPGLVAKIKREISILQFFPNAERKNERYYIDWCPFHPDKANNHTKSFWIDTRNGICNCHACSFPRPMDVINLVARLNNTDNSAAIETLRSKIM